MKTKAFEAIDRFDMLSNVSSIVVGVSGGADSIAALHFLLSISEQNGIKIVAAHLNHLIRGDESYRDEEFVRLVCKNWGIKLYVKREDIKELSYKSGQGIEECGRNERYSFFEEVSLENNAKIATAHTLSDNMETMLINLIRGCGLNGLCGIPPVRGNIIRPLILASRSETEEYCRKNSLQFVNDSTNFELDYTRNKIRLEIIPLLKKLNPSFDNVYKRFFENISYDNEYLNEMSEKAVKKSLINEMNFKVNEIKSLPTGIMRRTILKILSKGVNKNIANKDVDSVIKLISGQTNCVCLNKDLSVRIKEEILYFDERNNGGKNIIPWEYTFESLNVLTEIKKTFIINILSSKEYSCLSQEYENINYNCISMDNIFYKDIVFRNRRPGDVFSQAGRKCTKTIKKLFNELKIPKNMRSNLAMLANKKEIIWIHNIGVSEKYKVTKDTKVIAMIKER